MDDDETPTWSKPCERCGQTVERWRGQGDVTCHNCGAEYNAGGQRLRDDWRGNPSNWDDDVSDLDGYEIQHTRSEYMTADEVYDVRGFSDGDYWGDGY